MVLSDGDIRDRITREGDRIGVDPFEPSLIQPASLDVRLGRVIRVLYPVVQEVDLRFQPDQAWTLLPGMFALATTREWVEIPTDLVARLEGKSTVGRMGLIVHATAGYVDPGFRGELTLEMSCFMPCQVRYDMSIAQLGFHLLTRHADKGYSGKYLDQRGPTEARR